MDNNKKASSKAATVLRRIGGVIIALIAFAIPCFIGWLCFIYRYDPNWDNLHQSQQTAFGIALGVSLIFIIPVLVLGLIICVVGHFSLVKNTDKKLILYLAIIDVLTLVLGCSLGQLGMVFLLLEAILFLLSVILSVMFLWKQFRILCIVLLGIAAIITFIEILHLLPHYTFHVVFPVAANILFLFFGLNAVILWNSKPKNETVMAETEQKGIDAI